VCHLDIVYDLSEHIGLHISKAIYIIRFAVGAERHVAMLSFHIFDQAGITQQNGALAALLGVHWHLQTDEAAHNV
jgi:hypothetical protein